MLIEQFSTRYTPEIQAELKRQLACVEVAALRDAMGHLLGRGKLFRPLLALAACQAVSGSVQPACMTVASALELIHTFSLIHDDLPCMDDARQRRGVPAVHLAFDEAQAVLAGDALLNLAHYHLAHAAGLTDALRLQIISITAWATHKVVEGQVLDLQAETRMLELPELEALHAAKTGALISACCQIGALLGGAEPEIAGRLSAWGTTLGLAFQIRDDLLSVQGTEAVVGKTLSTDAEKQKATYPRLLGVAEAEAKLDGLLTALQAEVRDMELTEPELLIEFVLMAGRRER